MTRLQLFQEMYNFHTHNLLCYSKNYLMAEPKEKHIQEWKLENEKIELLEEIIKEEKQKEEEKNMSFTQEQILKMYPDTQYYVRNSNGGLLAGTNDLKEAQKYAERYKREYLQDSLNNHLGIFVYDKDGKNVYVAKGIQNDIERQETEEFE